MQMYQKPYVRARYPIWAILVATLLVAVNACAQDTMLLNGSNVPSGSGVSRWIGTYDPFSKVCEKDILTLNESTFTWGEGCKAAKIRSIAKSEKTFSFEVDSKAKCGWAGWIVSLSAQSVSSGSAVEVNAFRNMNDFKVNQYKAYCGYTKR